MQGYLKLPMFDDVLDGLKQLRNKHIGMYAFSNGVPEDLEKLLAHSQAIHYMDGVVSVDSDKTFKPNPIVYQTLMSKTKTKPEDCWLISSNSFDVCGAISVGMRAIWLQRDVSITFDPWEYQPTHIVSNFSEICNYF